jgi:dihydroorotase
VLARLEAGRQAARAIEADTGRVVFYGLYGGITSDPGQIGEMVETYREADGAMVGLKLFAGHSTGGMGLVTEERQRMVYQTLASLGYRGVLAVHCEKESLLQPGLWDPAHPESHCLARPAEAEIASIADQIDFAHEVGFEGVLHICHISTRRSIQLVAQARAKGMRITCGATPHHALLDADSAGREDNLLKMNPPLRDRDDRDAVFQGLLDGSVDWIESDHAPHTIQDKRQGASGIPGFAGMLLLVQRLRAAGAAKVRLQSLCGERVRDIFRIAALDAFATPDTLVQGSCQVPASEQIDTVLAETRAAYAWDPFCALKV